jgi:hypothetical protein
MDVQRMRKSFDKVASFGDEVPLFFYSHLFLSHPETRAMFPVSMMQQRDRLFRALGHIVARVDDLDVLVPFLQQLGVAALMAHFFVFYFAVYSALTPPVAVASLAAAKIAGADLNETTWESQKLMLTTFVIPFAFVYYPSLMSFPNVTWEVLIPITTCLVLQWTVAIACYGYFLRDQTRTERWLWGAISLLGYAALCGGGIAVSIVFGALMSCLAAYVYLTRESGARIAHRPTLEPRAAATPTGEAIRPMAPTQGRFE